MDPVSHGSRQRSGVVGPVAILSRAARRNQPSGAERWVASLPRKRIDDVTPKQQEILELILNSVRHRGFQPNHVELAQLTNISLPSVRQRIEQLIEKGFLLAPERGAERSWGFPGIKFLAYQVDEEGNPVGDQKMEIGGYVVTFRKTRG